MRKVLYVEDFAYGSDCLHAIARALEDCVDGVVHLHDKLTEAAVEKFVQGDYDAVVSHLLHQSIRDSIDPDNRIRALEHESYREILNFITPRLSKRRRISKDNYFYGPYSYNFELLTQMRRHKDVPIVVFSGCDTDYEMCGDDYDAFVRKKAGVPLLCETFAVLLDRYAHLQKEPNDSQVIEDGQRICVTTTIRNSALTMVYQTAPGRIEHQISGAGLIHPEVIISSGLSDERSVRWASQTTDEWKDALTEVFDNCLLGLTITISADRDNNGETADKLAAIAKWVNTRFSWEEGS